jgi:diguanylate cyclase (GGDEF)-like protein/PAS domain S-box-containing protein
LPAVLAMVSVLGIAAVSGPFTAWSEIHPALVSVWAPLLAATVLLVAAIAYLLLALGWRRAASAAVRPATNDDVTGRERAISDAMLDGLRTAAFLKDTDGHGEVINITRLRAAEEILHQNHHFLERVLNAIPHPIFVKDRDHRFVFLNDALCSAFGFGRLEMLGKTDHDFFPKEQADVFVAKDTAVFASGTPDVSEETITDANGMEHVILTRKAAFVDSDGQTALVGVITDVTEHKRHEDMLRLSAEVFEHSAEGILITDDVGTILSVNRAFTDISGYSADEVVGKNARILNSGQQSPEFFNAVFRTVNEQGFWRGEMVNRHKSGEIYVVEMPICAVRDNSGRIRRYIAIMDDVTERKSDEERMRFLAQHDFLTGLANRGLLDDRIAGAILRARRNRHKVGVLMLDLDRFKQVNDTWGHDVGDLLLKQVASRLTKAVRQTDTVSRVGGDEFVVVLSDVRGRDNIQRIAEKITQELTQPYDLNGIHVTIGASIGISVFPDDATDHPTLCRIADAAMYQVKQQR